MHDSSIVHSLLNRLVINIFVYTCRVLSLLMYNIMINARGPNTRTKDILQYCFIQYCCVQCTRRVVAFIIMQMPPWLPYTRALDIRHLNRLINIISVPTRTSATLGVAYRVNIDQTVHN